MKRIIVVFMLSVMVTSCAARFAEELEDQNLNIEVKPSTSSTDTIFSTMRTSLPDIDTSYTAERVREAILTGNTDLSDGQVTIKSNVMKLGGDPLQITVDDIVDANVNATTVGKDMPLLLSTLKDIINNEWLDHKQKNKFVVDIVDASIKKRSTTKTSKELETLIITLKPFARSDHQIAPDLASKEYIIEIILNGNDIWQGEALLNLDLKIDVDINKIEASITNKFKDEDITATLKSSKSIIKPVSVNSGEIFNIDIGGTVPADETTKIVSAADTTNFIEAIINGLDASRETDYEFTIEEDKRKISTQPDNNLLTIYLKPIGRNGFAIPATAMNKFYKVKLTLTTDSGYTWQEPIIPVYSIELFTALKESDNLKMKKVSPSNDAHGIKYEKGSSTFISKGYVTQASGEVLVIESSLSKIVNATFGSVMAIPNGNVLANPANGNKQHGTYKLTVTAKNDGYIIMPENNAKVTYTIILRVDPSTGVDCTICLKGKEPDDYCNKTY